MRALYLLTALVTLVLPACETIRPKAKLAVEAPTDLSEARYKLEVTLN